MKLVLIRVIFKKFNAHNSQVSGRYMSDWRNVLKDPISLHDYCTHSKGAGSAICDLFLYALSETPKPSHQFDNNLMMVIVSIFIGKYVQKETNFP